MTTAVGHVFGSEELDPKSIPSGVARGRGIGRCAPGQTV